VDVPSTVHNTIGIECIKYIHNKRGKVGFDEFIMLFEGMAWKEEDAVVFWD
jgi:hypothetical protein